MRITSLSALGSRLSALGSRLSALGSRLSALGSRLSALGSRLSALGSRLSALGSRLSALGSRLSALGSRLSALGSRLSLSALGSRLSALGSRLSALLFLRHRRLSDSPIRVRPNRRKTALYSRIFRTAHTRFRPSASGSYYTVGHDNSPYNALRAQVYSPIRYPFCAAASTDTWQPDVRHCCGDRGVGVSAGGMPRRLYDVCHTDGEARPCPPAPRPKSSAGGGTTFGAGSRRSATSAPVPLRAFYRKCGKPGCHCAAEGAPGHGPGWVVSRRAGGRTVNRGIPADAVEETQALVAEHRRFRRLVKDLTEANEALCQARLEAHIETGKNRAAR